MPHHRPAHWWSGPLRRLLLSADEREKIDRVVYHDVGHGFDPFGLCRDNVALGLALFKWLYRYYFRVESRGSEHIPAEGAAILASNHSGTLPLDGLMVWVDVLLAVSRVARPVADHFVPRLPFVGTFFARGGVVGGSWGNVRALLDAGELLLIFPEGVPGIGKGFANRYHLESFRVGHAELAMRYQVPVVPTAVIGAEEQMPQLARIELPRWLFGIPYLPVAVPLPLPVRYHIRYGEPMDLGSPAAADDPEAVRRAAGRVQAAVQQLIDQGLEEREGVFR